MALDFHLVSFKECSRKRQEKMSWLYGTSTAVITVTAARIVPAFVSGLRLGSGGGSMIWADSAKGVAGEVAVGGGAGLLMANPLNDWASESICEEKICSADKAEIEKWLGKQD
jgi:hypothetical protein